MRETVEARTRTRQGEAKRQRARGLFLDPRGRPQAGEETDRAPLRGRATGSDVAMTGKDADGWLIRAKQRQDALATSASFARHAAQPHQIPLAEAGQSRSSVMSGN